MSNLAKQTVEGVSSDVAQTAHGVDLAAVQTAYKEGHAAGVAIFTRDLTPTAVRNMARKVGESGGKSDAKKATLALVKLASGAVPATGKRRETMIALASTAPVAIAGYVLPGEVPALAAE
jgi:hypothetical protein